MMNELHKAYMNGNCHHLARALHAQFGAGIGIVLDLSRSDPDDPEPLTIERIVHGDVLVDHVFAMLPDGRAIDIQGACEPGSILTKHYWPGGEMNTCLMINLDPSLIDRLICEAGWTPAPPGSIEGLSDLNEVVDNLLRELSAKAPLRARASAHNDLKGSMPALQ